MLRVVLIGAGDIKFHYSNLLSIPNDEFNKHVEGIAKALQEAGVEIVLLPDRGISFEVAKRYKGFGGSKVIGTVPKSDNVFGIKHLKPYMESKVNGKKIFDEFIDTDNWYKQDMSICLFGDLILMLGNSLGTMRDLVAAYYLYKLFAGDKPEVKIKRKAIHPEARGGENVPFSLIVYQPFLKEKLDYEIEAYIKKLNGNIYYAKSPSDIRDIIKRISSNTRL